MNSDRKREHIVTRDTAKASNYRNPRQARSKSHLIQRNRNEHGTSLKTQIKAIEAKGPDEETDPLASELDLANGSLVEFISEPGFELALESLENARQGIELANIKRIANQDVEDESQQTTTTYAVVYVPNGKLGYFTKKIDDYLANTLGSGKPKNQKLVESISQIRIATLQSLWTDPDNEFPEADDDIWWEAWLRNSENITSELSHLRREAERHGLKLSSNEIRFPNNTIILVQASLRKLMASYFLLDVIAELRSPTNPSDFIVETDIERLEQWAQGLCRRIQAPKVNAPAVCLLDTGVANGHPLVSPGLDNQDMHSYLSEWGVGDDDGHGTEMAGLSLYGDMFGLIPINGSIELLHRLESVKIMPYQVDNDPKLYGAITRDAIAQAEQAAAFRKRAACLAVTARENKNNGLPSSWSAAIDQIISGATEEDKPRRILCVSAGNVDTITHNIAEDYPNINDTDPIHDPGQSWNALTIGAFTNKTYIDPEDLPNWWPLAKKGALGPRTTTSLPWDKQWPTKPDIVLEGGNLGVDPATNSAQDHPDSLRLLTTRSAYQFQNQLTTSGDTSGSTALASRMAAIIYAHYPDFWPETIRGLLVQSASWTEEMLGGRDAVSISRKDIATIMRRCGYGVPNLDEALFSANNSLTLIAQDELQPFEKVDSRINTKELHLHTLPWPKEVLEDLSSEEVELRVTLSYYVEPNPGSRTFSRKHQYASHGLRFEVKSPTETADNFEMRLNQMARQDSDTFTSTSDTDKWIIGPNNRSHGSIHSDIWRGTAAELANKSAIAIYPVGGWWKENRSERFNDRARYALIVTLRTPRVETDIYSPVLNQVETPISIPIEISDQTLES